MSRYQLCTLLLRRVEARQRPLAERHGRQPRRAREALLRAAVRHVDLPVIDPEVHAAERGDAVHQQQRVRRPRRRPISSSGCRTPVEVSACTTATSFGRVSRMAAATASGSMMRPHAASTRRTSAPQREATSHIRSPKTPFTPMTTAVPRLQQVDEGGFHPRAARAGDRERSAGCACGIRRRSSSIVSSIRARNCGSRCPIVGCAIACSTRG